MALAPLKAIRFIENKEQRGKERKKELMIVALLAVISLLLSGCFLSGQTSEVTESYLLLQTQGEPEVFVIIDKVKHWIQNSKTAQVLGYDLLKRKIVSLDVLNKYPTGETLNRDPNEPTRQPRAIYFLKPKPYPFKGLRGLLTLKPLPKNAQQVEDLGFNAVMHYGPLVSGWKGNVICRGVSSRNPMILRYTGDELDCRRQDPQVHLDICKRMKKETPDVPVGIVLCSEIGCGLKGTANSIEEYQRKWIEVANQLDVVMISIYPYREDWPNALEKMVEFEKFWRENIKVPIIPIIQAHWGYWGNLTRPNPMEQVKFWVDRGYGYVVYPWRDEKNGVEDMQAEWKKANEWAKQRAGSIPQARPRSMG
ncbi:MAG: hypothetical protein E3J56_09105 [Candidatus Aminicenantes bacterium]|nr:MAG: hypothetical protein E3J56_09105 [Candidatus Aminicenantes bacterium]